MRFVTLALFVVLAAEAAPAAAAQSAAPPSGCSVSTVDRECLARRARRDRAELDRARVPARTALTPPVVRPGVGALRISIDPVTGRQVFDVVPAATAPEAGDRSAEGLTVVRHSDGSESVDLGERFMEYAVVQVAPDGTKKMECVSTTEGAQRLVTTKAPAAKPAAPRRATPRRDK